jgi:hypothetical protein
VVNLGLGVLELVQARLELLIKLLDLLVDGAAGGLVALLGLANGIELGLKLLLALRVRGVLVRASAAREVDLGLCSRLQIVLAKQSDRAGVFREAAGRICDTSPSRKAAKVSRVRYLQLPAERRHAPSRPLRGPP